MFEFLSANWVWILLAAGVLFTLSGRRGHAAGHGTGHGGHGAGHSGHAGCGEHRHSVTQRSTPKQWTHAEPSHRHQAP